MHLNDIVAGRIAPGQEYLAEAIKLLVYRTAPDVFERLDFNNDHIFLEPFLFAYFNKKSQQILLEQILYGYIEESKRPDEVRVYAENKGCIYLPCIGYFHAPKSNQYYTLKRIDDNYVLYDEDKRVEYRFETLLFIPGTTFELHRHSSLVFQEYFKVWNDDKKDFEAQGAVEIERTTELHLSRLATAMEILRHYSPLQYEHYLLTTRRFVVFTNPLIRNFAVRDLHGTAFISARPEHSEIFFLEEIIHQSSHNVFNAITAKLGEHFLIDPETPLKQYSDRTGEFRSIYSAYHGLYTVTTRLLCFDDCLDHFEGNLRYEVAARLADLRRRFRNGLEKMNLDEVFTPGGKSVYQELDYCCNELFKKRNYLIGRFDYSNQKAGFNFDAFLQNNPVEKIEQILQPTILQV